MIAWLLLMACNEVGFTDVTRTDVFQQDRARAVDLLLVVDSSCSMVEEQGNLARNFDTLIRTFQEADVDWRIAVATTDVEDDKRRGQLVGGADTVAIRGPVGTIDRVSWDRSWPMAPGVALQLMPTMMDPASNDAASAWCPATLPYGGGQLGSPGAQNPTCAGADATVVPSEADMGPVTPTIGELVISELLPMSTGDDAHCEWFELTNLTDNTLDLTGFRVVDDGVSEASFPAGTLVGPREALVVGRDKATADNCGTPVDVGFATGLSMMDDLIYLDSEVDAGDELFAELVRVGTSGSGIELGFEAARLTFQEPEYSTKNGAWLRDEAVLALLFVSDEDDLSPGSVDDYLKAFGEIKGDRGFRDPGFVRASAVVGKDVPPTEGYPSCESEDGIASYGSRYVAAAARTGGISESICAPDFAPVVERLGLTLAGLSRTFALSGLPDLSTLEVKLYEDESDASLIGELERDVDFVYEADGNLLRFEEVQVPPAGSYLLVKYELLPEGASNQEVPL